MEDGKYVDGSLWFYAPNKVAPVIWAFLFLVSGIWHAWQCIHYKSWKVSGILPWSALLFVIGYILREIGAFDYDNLNIFIASLVFIYAAPPIYELSNYFILSRILYYIPYHSPIHPGRVLTTFGALSAVVEALNGNGAAYVANTSLPESKQNMGKNLLKSALVLQLAILGAFVVLAVFFHHRCKRANLLPANLHAALVTLYISSALIGVRTIYRTVEYFTVSQLNFTNIHRDSDLSPLLRYEWFFWVFEGVLMIINTFLLNFRHPMRFIPRDNTIYLAEDGVTEIQGPGYLDKRPFLVTFFDPFDISGALKGRNMNKKFWETHQEGRVEGVKNQASDGDAERGVSGTAK
ncbi:RTA1 like protein-domain-containing protein [Leptodontidium sp. 2 PMI_412]|nr:RTA1 like protein-domain-containing protein [Leptodontidium sp. MPI-SDFR-AT-0119]KAH9212972.1 RTA1 like protein-domain-containing protein [Leptodontidium sp. 2 PMI_412]